MVKLGRYATLEVVKVVDFGVYLNGNDFGQVLLPRKHQPKDCQVGDKVRVFLYLDSNDVIVATTQRPRAQVGEFANLKVIANNKVGAFLDWGLDKDLLLPFSEQKRPAEEGRSQIVYVHVNHADERIMASAKIDRFLDKEPANYANGEEVNLIIAEKTELGFKAIINSAHWGVVFRNEVFQPLHYGQKLKGFIKQVRADGKIDLVLQKSGKQELDKYANTILIKLKQADGFLPLTDKTDAELIYETLSMSKKAFKKTIGGLFKKQLITIQSDGIKINSL
ncbi:GntR family transcriptional regulator [Parashewanella spongiae]|uniref:GntR family transcriptional regulator n=1 Tax=Parashewanella spongiae TaxID=342950 RepID=A0A3A6UJD1_9GAMM|nr:S1-like domain-containing RNA-binding protein [Parashewanella spongiae]MCL1076856.1 S1-like domain-containing RNA-binding protein [Parashewanella spongiae]RJY19224.1 GntR family transcriptional regulator [Parashewanella spongiae]